MTAPLASTANKISLGNRVLELRGLRMEHVRQGLLEQMNTVTEGILDENRKTLTRAQIEAHVDIVAASVDDQINRVDFDKLLNALGPIEGTNLLTSAIGPILTLSGFLTGAPKKLVGEGESPAA